MTAPAKVLWREIVADRPVDFFRPGSLDLLESFCQLTIESQRIIRVLARTRVGTGDYIEMQKMAARNSSMLTTLGSKLRLTVQADTDGRSKKTGERGDASADDGLIGGAAVNRQLRVVKG
ncbi:MAG TPA: hypothetical protein VHQ92_06060 [Pseudolabrys sp.]|nr:hypothetical protein [Pseudolabrys sp.]